LLDWLGALDLETMIFRYNKGDLYIEAIQSKRTNFEKMDDFIDLGDEMDNYAEKLEGVNNSSELKLKFDCLCRIPLIVEQDNHEF